MPNIVSNAELLVALLKTSSITDEHQALITLFHNMTEDAVKGHLKYDPTYQTHVEIYPVQTYRQASNRLQLRHIPVRRVTEVVLDESAYGGQAADAFETANGAETLAAGSDYFVRFGILPATIGGSNGLDSGDGYNKTGLITRINGDWPCVPGTLKVTYVAGYTDQEFRGNGGYHTAAEIKKATLDALIANFKELITQAESINSGQGGTIVSERMGDYSYTLDSMSLALTTFSVTLPSSSINGLQNHRHFGIGGL